MVKSITQCCAFLFVASVTLLVGCVSHKTVSQELRPEDIRHISMILLQVTKEQSYEQDGAIEIRVWWTDVWNDVRGIPREPLAGDDPKREEVLSGDHQWAGDYCSLLPCRTTTHKLNEAFTFGWLIETDPSWSECFYYLKGTEWHREEKFSGFRVQAEIAEATAETIHLKGTISRLNHSPFSYLWPFDVIIPYEKRVIIWEMREWPKESPDFCF